MSCVTVAGLGVNVTIYEIQHLVHSFQERRKNICRGGSLDWDRDERAAKGGCGGLVLAENADDEGDSFAFVSISDFEIISGIWSTECGINKC